MVAGHMLVIYQNNPLKKKKNGKEEGKVDRIGMDYEISWKGYTFFLQTFGMLSFFLVTFGP